MEKGKNEESSATEHTENKTAEKSQAKPAENNEETVNTAEQAEQKTEPKLISLTQEDYNNIKRQMAKVMNDSKDLERDFDSYRSRVKTDIEDAKQDGMESALKTIFPALDSFKKARKIVCDKATMNGIDLIEKNILSALHNLKVEKIDCVGKKFDPNFHNAVMMMQKDNTKSGTVIEEVEAGYTLNGKVIKYSQVIVAK
jgi:molecular chaperone GrpE